MDPIQLLELIGAVIGGGAIVGVGAWGVARGRGKDRDAGGKEQSGSGSAGTTAVKERERPAAPTWGDTLSAPTRPAPDDQAEKPAEPASEASAAPAAPGAEAAEAQRAQAAPVQEPATAEKPAAESPAAAAPEAPADQAAAPEAVDTAAASAAPEASEPEDAVVVEEPARTAPLETPEPAADRMVRLRERLARSGAMGRGLLSLLSRDTIDEDTWDEIEETLLLADLGSDATDELMEALRKRMQVLGSSDPAAVREVLREELIALIDPSMDRRLAASARTAADGTLVPSAILMVGVNGTGKTTTVGKLARVLVAEGRTVVLGAADTFRAAAADQLATWGARVGVETVRSERDGADPASVAFDAVKEGISEGVDVVIIDTAGRLQNKKGLMDELGKVRRVAEKALHEEGVQEVLLVLDATTGQNGMQQARVFAEAVNITGLVLTKLDGTAKGGIVVNVQKELGVPVKMVGLGEGMDDLAPFDPYGFVDALLDA